MKWTSLQIDNIAERYLRDREPAASIGASYGVSKGAIGGLIWRQGLCRCFNEDDYPPPARPLRKKPVKPAPPAKVLVEAALPPPRNRRIRVGCVVGFAVWQSNRRRAAAGIL